MEVTLVRAGKEDIRTVWEMQVEAFTGLLQKYGDVETSPASEPLEKVEARFGKPGSVYYFIMAEGRKVGVIRVVDLKDGSRKRISPLWIMPEFRNRGYAQLAMKAVENLHGEHCWSLDTILQEEGNIHLYEKMGYRRTGMSVNINDKMDIIYFEKD